MWFLERSDTNWAVQAQNIVNCEADLRLCFSHMQIVGFLIRQLIYVYTRNFDTAVFITD